MGASIQFNIGYTQAAEAVSAANTAAQQVDTLLARACDTFEESGSAVAVHPLEGTDINCVLTITPTQDGTPTPDAPIDIECNTSPLVRRYNGQTLNTHCAEKSWTINGATLTSHGDGTYTLTGTTTGSANFIVPLAETFTIPFPGAYQFAINNDVAQGSISVALMYVGEKYLNLPSASPVAAHINRVFSFTISEEEAARTYNYLHIWCASGLTLNMNLAPAICATTPEDFEAYGGYDSVNPALPADFAGGTVNLTTGEAVQEWAKIDSYAGETIPGEYLSTTGELSTGATVYYKLATPITSYIDPVALTGADGVNTILSDADSMTVTGYEDPRYTRKQLVARIEALESNAVS